MACGLMLPVACKWWFVLGAGVDNILVSKYARTQCTAVARSLTLCFKSAHELPSKTGAMRYSKRNIVRAYAPYWH